KTRPPAVSVDCMGWEARKARASGVAPDLGIETGTAGHKVAHLRSQLAMDFGEKYLSQIETNTVSCMSQRQQTSKARASRSSTTLDFLGHPLVNQVEELRDASEERNSELLQCTEQLGRVQALQIDHTCADREWQQKICHLCERVEERQHA